MANLNGTSASETLTGTADADVINSKTPPVSGSDTVLGLGGDDVIYGGVESGDSNVVDSIDGGDGNDTIRFDIDKVDGLTSASLLGGAGDDAIFLSQTTQTNATATGAITVDGGAGTDTLTLSGATDSLLSRLTFSGLEQLTLSGVTGGTFSTEQVAAFGGHLAFTNPPSGDPAYLTYAVRLSDGGTADLSAAQVPFGKGLTITAVDNASTTVTGTAASDILSGGDSVSPTSGVHYVLHGGAGDDSLQVTGRTVAADTLDGGAGNDTLYDASNAAGDLIDGGAGTDLAYITLTEAPGLTLHLDDFATATGVTFADRTTVRNVEQVSLSLTGDSDTAYAGAGGSAIYLTGSGTKAYGGAGNDTLSAQDVYVTPGGHDTANGTFSHIDYSSASAPVHMSSTTTHSRVGDYYSDEAWVGGTATSDAGSSASVTFGRAEIFGSAFGDTLVMDQHYQTVFMPQVDLYGGVGDDTIFAGPHGAILAGGDGMDTLDFSAIGTGANAYTQPPAIGVTVDLSVVGGQATGYGVDTLSGFENVVGTAQADQLSGDGGANQLYGGAGDDTLSGAAGNDTLAGGPGNDVLFGGDGDDTVVFNFGSNLAGFQHVGATLVVTGPDGSDTLAGIEHLQFADAVLSLADVVDRAAPTPAPGMSVTGTSGMIVQGGSGNDLLNGSSGGNDTFEGGPGSDTINGGDGIDTAIYAGRSLFYQIVTPAQASFGSFYVSGGDEGGTDNLGGVDYLRFLDGTLTFDVNSEAAQIYRLYDTFLNRPPDVAGFDAYQQYLASGHTLHDAAVNASASPEFQAAASSLSNADFVAYIYENTLDRAPDPYGLQQYTALLDGGESRVDFAYSVINSDEHIQHTSPAVYAGLWEPDVPASGLALLYDTLFQREPDAYGLKAYEAELASGVTFRQIANQSVSSAEYQAKYGGTTDKEFIDQLYENTVHREPDAYGENAYLQELQHGYTRGDVIWQVSISAEHESFVLSHPDPSLFVF